LKRRYMAAKMTPTPATLPTTAPIMTVWLMCDEDGGDTLGLGGGLGGGDGLGGGGLYPPGGAGGRGGLGTCAAVAVTVPVQLPFWHVW